MDLYSQEREVQLLGQLSSRLSSRSVIDVGAERGAFVSAFLDSGSTEVHAIEPDPENAAALRAHFQDDPRVVVHEYALTDTDGPVELRRSATPAGEPLSFGHTLLERPDTNEISWPEAIVVPGRTLASLVEAGEIPRSVGVLKVDAEGSDLAVVSALGELECDVIMVEHWTDLPQSLGRCPWRIDDFTRLLRPRGFSHFAFLEHRGEFAVLKWDTATVAPGRMGNAVFVHDRVLDTLMPVILDAASSVAEQAAELTERYAAAAHERLAVIEELEARQAAASPTERYGRVQFWLRPRLGTLHHHDPKPLKVPAAYFETLPPTPPPTISIVTPSLQQGRFLERALFSVVSQDYPALEYVVQDGGSSDNTVDVLRRFEAALTLWRSEPDDGQGDAINRAFKETSGEIMAWLNADDLLLPGSLAYVARYFASHPDVDVVYGNRLMIDARDAEIGRWVMPAHDDEALTLADYVPQETLFWRRRIWDAVGAQVDARFEYALDWDLLVRFRAAGANMARLPRYLGAFRVHPGQKTTAMHETGAIECDVIRERLHGRPVLSREAFVRLRPYLVKSMLADMQQRVRDRLVARHVVPTRPDEAGERSYAPARVEQNEMAEAAPAADA